MWIFGGGTHQEIHQIFLYLAKTCCRPWHWFTFKFVWLVATSLVLICSYLASNIHAKWLSRMSQLNILSYLYWHNWLLRSTSMLLLKNSSGFLKDISWSINVVDFHYCWWWINIYQGIWHQKLYCIYIICQTSRLPVNQYQCCYWTWGM